MNQNLLKAKSYKLKALAGFTIIELLIAIVIFSVVVSFAVGGFVRALRTQRQVISLMAANSNVSLAIEQMAREIRTARNFTIANVGALSVCGAGRGTELTFTDATQNHNQVTYRFNFSGTAGWIDREIDGVADHITGENVRIRYLCFGLSGEGPYPPDDYPPRITISIGISPIAQGVSENITNIQTTVSARQIDS